MNLRTGANFDGPEYEPELDKVRLTGQIERVYNLMKDMRWRSLNEIAAATHDPQSSVSAQLRHLRKKKFGSHIINKRRRGNPMNGLYEYQLIVL